ncbi:zinc metalloprotease [Natrinema pallidum]|uniref:Thrombospondin type 3 repeat-containing protein n=1 Tax=Natrinema pallidum DSM 3751 TaxID=1227495 RepID=L9YQ31_9EURY|nr:hypothetical protein [Natrinema pallidum]ELY76239.1 hypothetical protein C487_12271 [Natrinema pallidum DSM 3751]
MLSARSLSIAVVVLLIALLTVGLVGGTTIVDPDGDDVSPLDELRDGTAVFDGDTDGDGLDDGAEKRYGTDPTRRDTDGDGLPDGSEVRERGTDPLEADTDGDGLTDGAEVRDHGTDPTTTDTDGDGLDDADELEAHGTDPQTPDTDGDGLTDGAEVHEHGTEPTESDTDGDGLADEAELNRRNLYPDADPLSTDIYVEIDTMDGVALERSEADRIAAAFDAAPLDNPDGSTGGDLHMQFNETVPREPSTDTGDLSRYRSRYFDREGMGYHYLIIVEDIAEDRSRGTVIGKAGLGTMMVEAQPGPGETGSTVMHELGHSLGLSNGDFEGIDTDQYSFASYTSVMNYNSPRDYYGFSAGGFFNEFDDWAYIDDHMFTPATSFVSDDE